MMKKNLIINQIILLILILFTVIRLKAQGPISCTPTNFNDLTYINSTGGNNASDGLKIVISGAGNLQVFRDGKKQMYGDAYGLPTYTPYDVPGTVNGILLTIGTSRYSSGTLTGGGSTVADARLTPIASSCSNTGNNYAHTITYSITKGSLVYGLVVNYSYTYPDMFFTINYDVTIPPGNTEPVKLSQAWDSFLDGGDYGPGFVSGVGNNLTMGTQKTVSGQVVYEAFKYKNGVPWAGYYSAEYSSMNYNLNTNGFIFNKTIGTSVTTDNGMGISINYGSQSGTYSSQNNVIFKCNSPTVAPAFSSNTYTQTCGSTVNLKANYTGTAEASLPAGVTLDFYDSTGNKLANPTAVSNPGIYYVYYSDANNAGCTSPTTALTVNAGSCCTASPVLSKNTITNTCPGISVNLNSLYTGTLPAGVVLEWYNNNTHTGSPVADPTNVTIPGIYYAFVHDTTNNCFSPSSSAVTYTQSVCCLAGTTAPVIN